MIKIPQSLQLIYLFYSCLKRFLAHRLYLNKNRLKNLIEINTFADKLDQKTNYDEFINNIENYKMDNKYSVQ